MCKSFLRTNNGFCLRHAITLALWLGTIGAPACGPNFPNWMLVDADRSVQVAPQASFSKELRRMKLITSRHHASPTNDYAGQTFAAELADLKQSLDQAGVPAARRDAVLRSHRQEREKISVFAKSLEASAPAPESSWLRQELVPLRPDPTNNTRISGSPPVTMPELPGEFADYFRGCIAWHQGKIVEARQAWNALLARQEADRRYRTTWALFMLGRSWEDENRRRAITCFRLVRQHATNGFADSLGLSAASLGYEARLHWREERFAEAIDLYLEQAATGDQSAENSLQFCCHEVMGKKAGVLRALAAHPRAQRLITAFVISTGWRNAMMDVDNGLKESLIHLTGKLSARFPAIPAPAPSWHSMRETALVWIEAVEAAKTKDMDSAEQIALAAYQAGQMDATKRWLQRASTTPTAQWLQAKLLLRDGKVEEAAALLAKVSRFFPLEPTATNALARGGLEQSLYVTSGEETRVSSAEQVHGELGVFQLAHRQYVEALDALLRSGFWADAAYVGECVLTTDELKTYVDRHWPEVPGLPASNTATNRDAREDVQLADPMFHTMSKRELIRYLLARRLARERRFAGTRDYYPATWAVAFDQFRKAIETAEDPALPEVQRAAAFFDAAKLARYQGLELIGTEVAPDWRLHGGNFEEGPDEQTRSRSDFQEFLAGTEEELQRVSLHRPDPQERFHYRWVAAQLAMSAAELMPNNSEETARVLCIGGSWLKNRDLDTADLFYKTLVRRCRKTAIGAEADRIRWFPLLDSDGNLLPRSKQPLSPQEQAARDAAKSAKEEAEK